MAGRGGARKGAGRPVTGRDDVSVKLDRTLVARARMIAGYRGETLASMLSGMLQAPVDKAYLDVMRALEKAENPADGR